MHCYHHHHDRRWLLLYLAARRHHDDSPAMPRLTAALSVILAVAMLAGLAVYAGIGAIVIWALVTS